MSVRSEYIRPAFQYHRACTKRGIFSYQEIFAMLVPLIFDQFFISVIALLTTAMISSYSQESVSAVSLVSPLYMMIYAVYSAISSAGTVIIAQYKGHGDEEKMKKAAGQIVRY